MTQTTESPVTPAALDSAAQLNAALGAQRTNAARLALLISTARLECQLDRLAREIGGAP